MKVVLKELNRLALAMIVVLLFDGVVFQKAQAQEVNSDTLCHNPLNSGCQEYKYPLYKAENVATSTQAPQIIKVKLKTSGPDNEWVRIEMRGNVVKLLHTTRAKTGFSQVINSVGLPVSFHKWHDHPTTRVTFTLDNCVPQQLQFSNNLAPEDNQMSRSPGCTITGTDTLRLAEGMDIYSGRFTMEYQEGDLLRSIAFRIPSEDGSDRSKSEVTVKRN